MDENNEVSRGKAGFLSAGIGTIVAGWNQGEGKDEGDHEG